MCTNSLTAVKLYMTCMHVVTINHIHEYRLTNSCKAHINGTHACCDTKGWQRKQQANCAQSVFSTNYKTLKEHMQFFITHCDKLIMTNYQTLSCKTINIQ